MIFTLVYRRCLQSEVAFRSQSVQSEVQYKPLGELLLQSSGMALRRHLAPPSAGPSPHTLLLLLCVSMAVVHDTRGQLSPVSGTAQPPASSAAGAVLMPSIPTSEVFTPETTSILLPMTSFVAIPSTSQAPSPSPSSSPPPPSSSPVPETTPSETPMESPTTESPTFPSDTTSMTTATPSSGLPMGAIIGIAVGGGAFLIVVFFCLICLCYCCLRTGNREDYKVAGPWMTVRHWDPRSQHTGNMERSGSMISKNSRGASLRSSISSIGSIIRFGSKRRSGKKGKEDGTLVHEPPATLTVTPL